jgi:hypothetical protein
MNREAIEHFVLLERLHRHPLRGRDANNAAFREAQELLYYLAQRICADHAPKVQGDLDRARREVVSALEEICGGNTYFKPARLRRPIRWCEYMLTPELEGNLALSGMRIPAKLARALQTAHRAQLRCVKEACGL